LGFAAAAFGGLLLVLLIVLPFAPGCRAGVDDSDFTLALSEAHKDEPLLRGMADDDFTVLFAGVVWIVALQAESRMAVSS
jgi:hypothetical protein